LSDTLIELIY